MRAGLFLGTLCALMIAGLAFFQGASVEMCLGLAIASLASLASAAVLGLVVPVLQGRLGLDTRLARGVTAGASAGISGLLIYLFLMCRLFG